LYHPNDSHFTHLAGTTLIAPYFNNAVPCIADTDVQPDKGTGLVMCCTFGDQTDITWYERHALPLKTVMDDKGIWLTHTGPMSGLRAPEARAAIINALQEANLLPEQKHISHAVSVHERCKQPIEYRVIPQWFIKIMENKELFLTKGEEVAWHPSFMFSRYRDWVTNLGWDWCISRQRFYGVPFPLWHCTDCKAVLTAPEESLPIDPTESTYPGGACHCGSTALVGETDVMDTWNISSLTPQINQATVASHGYANALPLPFSLRPQAHDIIRTWAFDTIVKSAYAQNSIPWTSIVISGHVTQGNGKISKSTGGAALTPQSLLACHSADAIRYWAAKASPGVDTAFSEEQIKVGLRLQTKLWNALRFINQQVPTKPTTSAPLDPINQWISSKYATAVGLYKANFEAAEYAKALESVENFFWNDFCDNYLELIKDRFFNPDKYSANQLNATSQTLYAMGYHLLQLYAPFMPFVTETLYQKLYRSFEGGISIHTSRLTDAPALYSAEPITEAIIEIVNQVRRHKSEAHRSLKTPLLGLDITVNTQPLAIGLLAEEATITGITKALAVTITTNTALPTTVATSMELAPEETVTL
jgi:valyl-tRNA synthetase